MPGVCAKRFYGSRLETHQDLLTPYQEYFQCRFVSIWIHIEYSSDAACYKDSIRNIADNPNEFPWLEIIKEIGVHDVRAAELSHESLVVRSWGGGGAIVCHMLVRFEIN